MNPSDQEIRITKSALSDYVNTYVSTHQNNVRPSEVQNDYSDKKN